jgi:hypothetical protein
MLLNKKTTDFSVAYLVIKLKYPTGTGKKPNGRGHSPLNLKFLLISNALRIPPNKKGSSKLVLFSA